MIKEPAVREPLAGAGVPVDEAAPVSRFRFGVLLQLDPEEEFFTLVEKHWLE